MNGVDRRVLVATDIQWPNGITLGRNTQKYSDVDDSLTLKCVSVGFSGVFHQYELQQLPTPTLHVTLFHLVFKLQHTFQELCKYFTLFNSLIIEMQHYFF